MKRGFVNQKLGKRNSRRAELQRAKSELTKIAGNSSSPGSDRRTNAQPRNRNSG